MPLLVLLASVLCAQMRVAAPRGVPAMPPAAPLPSGAAYASVLSERGWLTHRSAEGAYLLTLRRGQDAHGRSVFVMDAVDAANPSAGTVAHVDFAVHKEARQAVFDGPMDGWTQEPAPAPEGLELGDLSHGREHLWFGLAVRPEYRKRGLAGVLMDAAAALARAEGAEELIVYATDSSRSLYERLYGRSVQQAESFQGADGASYHRLVVALPETAPAAPRRDKTLRFMAALEEVRRRDAPPLPEAAQRAKVLIVPGLFANQHHGAFTGNLRRLAELGIPAELLRIDTEGRSAEGRAAIEAAVRAAPGPVILAGHSRGGVLAHDWYRLAPPELKAKVDRLVLIQAPLGGTAYADWVLGSWWRRLIVRLLGWRYRAELARTVSEMTTRVRAAVLAALPPWTPADVAKVWVLRTVKAPGGSLYGRRARHLSGLGAPETDGVVPAPSASVPGAADVVLRDVDHANTVLQRADWLNRLRGYRPHPAYDAGDLTEALVRLILPRS